MNEEVIFLTTAGFTIGLRLYKTEWPYYLERMFRERILWYYKGFLKENTSEHVDFWIDISPADYFDILSEKNNNVFIGLYKKLNKTRFLTHYHVSDIQFQIILRRALQLLLAKEHGFIFHMSASKVDGNAYVFMGKSGAGKSTVMEQLTIKYQVLADDMGIIRKENGRYYFYQTPFLEKIFWITKSALPIPLGKIFFLKKANYYRAKKVIKDEQIIKNLLHQIFTEKKEAKRQIRDVLQLAATFPNVFLLSFSLQNPKILAKTVESA